MSPQPAHADGSAPADGPPVMSGAVPSRDDVICDLRALRQRGLLRCATTDLPALRSLAVHRGLAEAPNLQNAGVEHLLRAAVRALGDEALGRAAQYLFGLVQGVVGRRPTDLRAAAAREFGGLSPETFRKAQEPLLLGRVADEMLLPLPAAVRARAPEGAMSRSAGDVHRDVAELHWQLSHGVTLPASRRYGPYHLETARPGVVQVVVDVGPVEELGDVQIVVSSENTYLLPARPFSNSLSGALRRATAVRGADGGLIADVVARELEIWLAEHGRPGGPVEPGVVAITSAGNLGRNGIIALLHAAIAVPKIEPPGYAVPRSAVSSAVARCFELGREVREREGPIVRAISFPLFGAGHSGLSAATSAAWLWTAVRRELILDPTWRVHLTTTESSQAVEALAVIAASAPARAQEDGAP